MEALRVEAVSKHYGVRKAVDGVSFTAAPGERVAIIGPNGAGKTTLLQMLAGALAPTSGAVVTDHAIGWVPQQAAVYGKLSVQENLTLFARLERVADVDAAVERWLEQTRLRERAREEVSRLSGGQRSRVSLAVALLDGGVVQQRTPLHLVDGGQDAGRPLALVELVEAVVADADVAGEAGLAGGDEGLPQGHAGAGPVDEPQVDLVDPEQLEAIRAALNPDSTEYLFFVADGTGGHAFSRTLAEHNAAVARWREIERQQGGDPTSPVQGDG